MLQLTDRQSAHTLTVLSLLTLFSFADIGNSANRSFWLAVRAVGCGCAIGAVYGYRKADQDAELTDENGRLLEAVGEVKQGHDWEKYNLQLQHQREIEHYDRALAQLQHQLQQAQSANLDQIEAEKDKLTIAHHRLQQEQEQLAQQNAQLDEHFAAQQQSLIDREAALEAATCDRAAELEAHLTEQQAAMREGFEAMWRDREATLAQEIEARDQMITDLEAQANQLLYHAHSLMQSDKTNGVTNEELLADRVIDYLHQHGIVIRSPQAVPYGKDKFRLSFSVQDIAPGKNDKKYATSLLEAYKWLQDRLLTGIPGTVPGCKTKPEATIDNGRITLLIDISGVDWQAEKQAKAKYKDILDPAPTVLQDLVQEGNHHRVNGQRDAGKTTFSDNLITLLKLTYPGIPIRLNNPLHYSPKNKWTIDAEWRDLESALDGLRTAAQEVFDRRDLYRTAVDQGLSPPVFEPVLFVVDEIDSIIAEYGEAARDELKTVLKMGTHYKVLIFYVGQTPLCSDLKLRKNDFKHTTNFFLGENIPAGIEESCDTPAEKTLWHEQHKLRKDAGQRFLMFVKVAGKSGFLMQQPEPEAYSHDLVQSPTNPTASEFESALEQTWQNSPDWIEPDSPPVENPETPELIDLNRLSQLGEDGQFEEDGQFLPKKRQIKPWRKTAKPDELVASAQGQIARLIQEGMTKPYEICVAIWGETIDPRALPYNGKNGVKVLIERMLENLD